MPVFKVTCPFCDELIKSAKPLPVGKKVKCPYCGESVPIRGGAAAEEEPAPKKKPAAPIKAAAKAPAKPQPQAAAKPKPKPAAAAKEEAVYSWKKEEDDGSDKPAVQIFAKEQPKKMKIVAEERIIAPSNTLLILGIALVTGSIVMIVYTLFPFFFSQHLVDPKDILTDKDGRAVVKSWADLKGEDEINQVYNAESRAKLFLFLWTGVYFLAMVYTMLICHGAVKMRFVESYKWAMAASIMVMPTVLGILVGMWCLKELGRPDVKAGFEDARKLEPV